MKNIYCMNCGSSKMERFMDLGKQPNGNVFPSLDEFDDEKFYPCVMMVCTQCWQVQLEEFPSVNSMFTNHPYITCLNQPVVVHFQQLVDDIITKFNITPNSLILDIGANDGTLLLKFRERGMRVLGMDPCKRTGALARKSGITVFETFWNRSSAEAMRELGGYPDLITATAVFYHVEDIHSFVQGLDIIMRDDTIFCCQCVYLKELIEKVQFDHFYHEHTMIHSIRPLQSLFSTYGLRLIDIDFYPIHGGSFVLYVGRENSCFPTTKNITETIAAEKHAKLDRLQTYLDFSKRVEKNKQELVGLLHQIKKTGKRVFGLGAPMKGNALLNYYGIGPELVECLTEINPYKVGRYAPGSHIPVVDEKTIQEPPDYYLLLSWNFIDFFIEKYT
ncbi:MAG: class I SAM-dependent methyltransferase, partial [Spirochaetota bacterium]